MKKVCCVSLIFLLMISVLVGNVYGTENEVTENVVQEEEVVLETKDDNSVEATATVLNAREERTVDNGG